MKFSWVGTAVAGSLVLLLIALYFGVIKTSGNGAPLEKPVNLALDNTKQLTEATHKIELLAVSELDATAVLKLGENQMQMVHEGDFFNEY